MLNDSDAAELAKTRTDLLAMRKKHGADTPIGHRCSNILEQLENLAKGTPTQQGALKRLLPRALAELSEMVSKGERQ